MNTVISCFGIEELPLDNTEFMQRIPSATVKHKRVKGIENFSFLFRSVSFTYIYNMNISNIAAKNETSICMIASLKMFVMVQSKIYVISF